jgi:hypothetical protein
MALAVAIWYYSAMCSSAFHQLSQTPGSHHVDAIQSISSHTLKPKMPWPVSNGGPTLTHGEWPTNYARLRNLCDPAGVLRDTRPIGKRDCNLSKHAIAINAYFYSFPRLLDWGRLVAFLIFHPNTGLKGVKIREMRSNSGRALTPPPSSVS